MHGYARHTRNLLKAYFRAGSVLHNCGRGLHARCGPDHRRKVALVGCGVAGKLVLSCFSRAAEPKAADGQASLPGDTMKRSFCASMPISVILAIIASGLLAAAEPSRSTFGWNTGYPAGQAGTAVITCDDSEHERRHRSDRDVVDMGQRLAFGPALTDLQSKARCAIDGEVFQIEAPARARGLGTRAGGEAAGERTGHPARSLDNCRQDSRPAGDWPCVHLTGELRVVWRTTVRDGGNSVREEIEIRPATADFHVREIVSLSTSLAGARSRGSVDGSPLVIGNFL